MPSPDNENRIGSARDPHEQWLDDLLAADREHVQKAAEERIAGGMYRRIIQAQTERGRGKKPAWRWVAASVVAATVILGLWVAVPRKPAPSPIASSVRPIPGSAVTSENKRAADNVTNEPLQWSPNSRPVRIRASDRTRQTVVPKQAVFPSHVVATEEERLLMDLARNHPKQLQEIAEVLSDQEKQEKAHSQSFEQWLRKGEQR